MQDLKVSPAQMSCPLVLEAVMDINKNWSYSPAKQDMCISNIISLQLQNLACISKNEISKPNLAYELIYACVLIGFWALGRCFKT